MLNMLKRRLFIMFAAFAVLGIIMTVSSVKDLVELRKPRGELETMSAKDFYSGRFVEGNVYELWDNYAYMEESDTFMGISYNSKVTAQYFALPLESTFYEEEPIFVAVAFTDSSDIVTAGKMSKETDDWYLYGKEPAVWTEMYISGKVTKLKGEGLKMFQNYINAIGYSTSRNMCGYVINAGNTGKNAYGGVIAAVAFTIIGIGGLAFMIIRRVISGSY